MATYCLNGRLNKFVKPESEGGREIQITILSLLSSNSMMSDNQIYEWLQNSGLDAEIKSLTLMDVKQITKWMRSEGLIGLAETQQITYTMPVE